jgi:arginine decarboxylase
MDKKNWDLKSALATYNVDRWGSGYFTINELGHVAICPQQDNKTTIDLFELVQQLRTRGVEPPFLLRFSDILRHRMHEIHSAFHGAIRDHGYKASYFCAYPIKVNHQRHLVEEVVKFGEPLGFGLEAGSKPELLAVLALAGPDTPIICNGFKDEEFLKMVVLGQKLGRKLIPVVEQFQELKVVVKMAEQLGVRPVLGVRTKLAARGSGRWQASAGTGSKFGLTTSELIEAVTYLKERGLQDSLVMLHFHLGSQITNIQNVKRALDEASHVYTELHRMGAKMGYMNVGGGLGIDYDGSQSNFESSINYTLQEYANDVVYRVMRNCDQAGVPHPILVSESGRALMAYNSVLVFEAIGEVQGSSVEVPKSIPKDAPRPLFDLMDAINNLNAKTVVEAYHDASRAMEETLSAFSLGHVTLEMRAFAENLSKAFQSRLYEILQTLEFIPEDLHHLSKQTSDTVFCNFSVFQSLPDSWAIKQLFPIMPIHRLTEVPTRRSILADLTCDSDGKIDNFPSAVGVKEALETHKLIPGEPYYLGAFLLGAYQETLGDLHNLFGDTHAVHVSLDENGKASIDDVIDGDSVREVLSYLQYAPEELVSRMRRDADRAVRVGSVSPQEARELLEFYEAGMQGYTYFE